jgi:hypothetical protein
MTLPSLSDYSEALQAPGVSLLDPELRACTVECTPLGVPRPRSGGFAITYHLHNHRHWAVRCFYRPVPDLAQRYQLITRYLQQARSPRFVSFEYQPEGIVVQGRRLPIVKMEWVKGETLGSFLARHYQDAAAVRRLREDFVDLVLHLEQLGVAHGDLQHGNLVVSTSGGAPQLRLIDYDGMYVPGMERSFQRSNEVGHPHYQHPARTNDHFGPYLDRFSAAIIYLSLTLIEQDPSLFERYHNGENLLFTSADYADPASSPLMRELGQRCQGDRIWENFVALLTLDPDRLPSFEDFYRARFQPSVVTPPTRVARSPYPVLRAGETAELLSRQGEVVEVIGKVVEVHHGITRFGDPYVFLNFGDWRQGSFYVILWKEMLVDFEQNELDPDCLLNCWVSVTGLVTSYKHERAVRPSPQIQLERVHQLQILSEEEAYRRLGRTGWGPNRERLERQREQPDDGHTISTSVGKHSLRPSRGPRRDRVRRVPDGGTPRTDQSPPTRPPRHLSQPAPSSSQGSDVGGVIGMVALLLFLGWLLSHCFGG